MKNIKWSKLIICWLMMFALFVSFSLPSNDAYAASSTKAKVITKTYKSKQFLKYPQVSRLKSTSAQKKINSVLVKHIQGSYKSYNQLKKDMEELQGDPLCKEYPYACQYDYTTSYKVKYNKNGKVSILIFDWMYAGGAHGSGSVTSYNFNLKTGKHYTLSDTLTSKAKYTKVTKYVKSYMSKHPDIFFESYLLDDFKVDKNTQFYYTDKGIALIFQEYEVAPYAVGNPVIHVPSTVYK